MTNQPTLKNDLPITKFDDDKLDSQNFVIQMRKIINNYNEKNCLTIGIMGPWGSGKTSIINMILDQKSKNILTEKKYKVMRFNPWNFSKQQDLYHHFFEQLKEILISNENDKGKKKHVKNIINRYLEKIIYNGTLSLSYPGIVTYSKTLGEKTIETQKKEIIRTLKYLRYRLIIIIDDIDRLTDEEARKIFILVKALADFPNIIYILPFDRNIILNSMGEMQKDYGEEFLEKIIQLQIDLPKIPKSKVRNIFKEELENLIKTEQINMKSEDRSIWPVLSFLTTIRDVNRYINNLSFYLPIMKEELNIFDYILLIGMQLFENKIYQEIKNNKQFFTRDLMNPDQDDSNKYQKHFQNILNKKENLSEKQLKDILKLLFPQLNNFDRNWDMKNLVPEWNSKLKICSYKMFDKYFELRLDESEMSNSYFEMIIQSEDYDFIKEKVLKNDIDGKSEDFLEKLKDNASKIDPKNIKLFFRLLYDIGDNLNVETGNILFSKNTLLLQNIESLSAQLTDSELYGTMHYSIIHAEEGLYLLVDDLGIHDQINHRYRFENEKFTRKKKLNDEQLDELKKQASIKIKKWADTGKIFEVYWALEVIYTWYFWNKNEYSKFIEKTISNNEELIKLLKIFIYTDSNEHKYKFNFNIMEKICPIDKIYNRIKNITPKLNENTERLVCESFINEYHKFKGNNGIK